MRAALIGAALVLLVLPGAAPSLRPGQALGQEGGAKPSREGVFPPGASFSLAPHPCPMRIAEFDRDGDGVTDRVVIETDLACSAAVRRAVEEAIRRLAAPEPKPARGL